MKVIHVSPLSVASFYTEIFHEEESLSTNIRLATGTSFAYKYNGKKYLITNYHIAYGRNAETNNVINEQGAIPNKMLFRYHTMDHQKPDTIIFQIKPSGLQFLQEPVCRSSDI